MQCSFNTWVFVFTFHNYGGDFCLFVWLLCFNIIYALECFRTVSMITFFFSRVCIVITACSRVNELHLFTRIQWNRYKCVSDECEIAWVAHFFSSATTSNEIAHYIYVHMWMHWMQSKLSMEHADWMNDTIIHKLCAAVFFFIFPCSCYQLSKRLE